MPSSQLVDFNHHKIRCTLHNNTWWFVISDVIAALTDSTNPANYIKDMKRRIPEFKKGWGQFATPLPIHTSGGTQKTNCTNIDGIFVLIKYIRSEKITQFKQWVLSNSQFFEESYFASIKNTYNFSPSFELYKALLNLPSTPFLNVKFVRLSKKKEELLELSAAIKLFKGSLKSTSCETKVTLNQMPQRLLEQGYKDIRGTEHPQWCVSNLEENLETLSQSCSYALAQIEKDPGGRQAGSKPLCYLLALVDIYIKGTNKRANCWWDEMNSSYEGPFYHFVIALLPTLRKMSISLGKKTSIGEYCKTVIRFYYEELSKKTQT